VTGPGSKDCRDYFISGGVHIGDYEGMYRDCEDPWRIEELGVRLDMKAALLLLENFLPALASDPLNVLDAGAGAGLFSLALYERLKKISAGSNPQGVSWPPVPSVSAGTSEPVGIPFTVRMTVSDISPTAMKQAKDRFFKAGVTPLPEFVAFDLRKLSPGSPSAASVLPPESAKPAQSLTSAPSHSEAPLYIAGHFHLIVLAQSLWGIVKEISDVLSAFHEILAPEGLLLISQHFPGSDKQKWGNEITGPEGFSKVLREASFSLLGELETDRFSNHHWGSLWRSI
jgi:SAM-dependent methyltransferase